MAFDPYPYSKEQREKENQVYIDTDWPKPKADEPELTWQKRQRELYCIEAGDPKFVEPTEYPGSFAVVILVETPEGFPCVRDGPRFGPGAKWKFVGGEGNFGETPRQAAVRETAEECGFVVVEAELELVMIVPRRNYSIYVYHVKAEVPTDGTLKRRGDEGEEVQITSALIIRRMSDDLCSPVEPEMRDFLHMHYQMALPVLRKICPDEQIDPQKAA